VAERLGRAPSHAAAVKCLLAMGAVAEPALIKRVPSNDAMVSLAAAQLLGEIGTSQAVPVLRRAVQGRNPMVRAAAKSSLQQISQRRSAQSRGGDAE
jgi:HEAT repeat protein